MQEDIKETIDLMTEMSQKTVDLDKLKMTIKGTDKETKVKIFGVKAMGLSPKIELENQINDFIKDKELIDVKFQCIKNYLPHTTLSEFEELMYAMVIYK